MSTGTDKRRWAVWTAAAALLAFMAVLAGGAALRESVTVDEIAHVGAGVSCLQRLDLRMNPEHPPLAKVLAAAPLVIHGVHADYSSFSWTFSGKSFQSMLGEWPFGHSVVTEWNEPRATMAWARAPMLLLTLGLGWLLFAYGSRLGNDWGGLLVLSVFVSMPAFLAFGPLVLTDVAITFFSILTVWMFVEMWQGAAKGAVLRFGLALAGALLSKFSAGLLFFFFIAFALSLRWFPLGAWTAGKDERRALQRRGWRNLGKGVAIAAATVYLVYLVLGWGQPTDMLAMLGANPAAMALRRLLMPPLTYLFGLVMFAAGASRPTFVLGHTYPHGVWFYFPVIIGLKSQLAFLLLLVVAAVVALVARRRGPERTAVIASGAQLHWRGLWLALAVIGGACILSPMDLSIRHALLPVALLMLLLAPLPRALGALRESGWFAARPGAWLTAALAGLSLVTAVMAYPHYFPFLNSLSSGQPGYELVNDSNLDWNEALPEVQAFAERRHLSNVAIDEYGFSEPAVYVRGAQVWDCQEPAASDAGRLVVVSASMIHDGHNCGWLLHYPHEALAGGGMYAFQLPAAIPQMGAKDGPPLSSERRTIGGAPPGFDVRAIFLKCIHDPRELQPTMDWMIAKYSKKK